MLQAATCVHQTIDDAAAAALLAIEREFGRDIFSSSYNKLARLCQLAQSFTKNQSRGSGTDATKVAVGHSCSRTAYATSAGRSPNLATSP